MKDSSNSGFVNPLLIYAIVGLGLSGSAGLGAVWMQRQISLEANVNKAIEARIDQLKNQSQVIAKEIAEEEDSSALLRRNAAWKLGLAAPAPGQILPVAESPVEHLARKRNREIFSVKSPQDTPLRLALGH